MQYGASSDSLLSNALFAAGAGAVVLSDGGEDRIGLGSIHGFGSQLIPDSEDAMSWRIGDHGFQMALSPRVPALIEKNLKVWLVAWLEKFHLSMADIGAWVAHPGGPRILDAVERSLELPESALRVSRQVLNDHGNMSSPTVLFILDRLRHSPEKSLPAPCVMLGFGPGLVIEAALIGSGRQG